MSPGRGHANEVTATGTDSQDPAASGEPLVASILDCVAQPVWMVDVPVIYTSVPFEASGGYGLAVSFADLTARRAAEQAVRERAVATARAAELGAARPATAGVSRRRSVVSSASTSVAA